MAAILDLALRLYGLGLLVHTALKTFAPNMALLVTLNPFYEPLLKAVHGFLYQQFPDLKSIPFDLSFLAALLLISLSRMLLKVLFRR